MTPSTQSHESVMRIPLSAGALMAVATGLVGEWCAPRETYLNRRQARTEYVVDTFKKVRNRIARPFDLLLAGSFADIDDGAPLHAVLRPYESAMAFIRERAASRERKSGLPFQVRLNAIMARETRAEGKVTGLQLALAADPQNLETRAALRTATGEYRAVLDDLDALLDEGIAAAQLERATA